MGTFLLTLGMALSIKYGKGKAFYNRMVDGLERKVSGIMGAETGRKFSEEVVQTTTLMQGGNAMLLPVGIAEHYKVPIVNGLNTMMGDPTPPEKIQESPKQTWWSLIEGRALAWTAVFTTLFGASLVFPKSFQTFTSEFGEKFHQIAGKFKAQRSSAIMKETRAYKVGELAALDVFATAAAVVLLYIGGHFFARKHEQKKEIKEARKHHHEGGVPGRDAEMDAEAPAVGTEVTGEKLHAGMVKAAPELAVAKG